MRLLVVTEAFFPSVDATTTTVRAVLDRCVDLGVEVQLVAPAPGLSTHRGVRVHRVHRLARRSEQVAEAIATCAPDLVLAVAPGALGSRALRLAGRLGVATAASVHAPVTPTRATRWQARVGEHADRVLVPSRWLGGTLADAGVPSTLWRPGVDVRTFSPALRDPWLRERWGRGRLLVGYAGSLEDRNGVRLLPALADLADARLVILGEGSRRGWLADRLPGARFTGALSTGHLAVAMAALDVLVHPGEEQTDAHALREAMASGVPVVAPRAGGAPEVVDALHTGLLHEPGSRHSLADAVGALLADPQRGLLGAEARRRAERRPWSDAVDELLAVLGSPADTVPQPVLDPRAGLNPA